MSPPLVAASAKRLNLYAPAGAEYVRPLTAKVGPLTSRAIRRQVPSPSATGSVAVTQSTILRSPVVVFCSAG